MKKVFLLALLLATISKGQGALLFDEMSGIGMSSGFYSNKDAHGVFWGVGYSFDGVFDINFSLGQTDFYDNILNTDLSSLDLTPSITYHPFKHNLFLSTSLSFNASYFLVSYSNDVLDNLNIQWKEFGFIIGSSLSRTFKLSSYLKIQPCINFSYNKIKLNTYYDYNIVESNEDNFFIYGISTHLIFEQFLPDKIIAIQPWVNYADERTTFGISVALVFITN